MFVFHIIFLLYTTIESNKSSAYSLTMGHKYVSSILDLPYHVLVVYKNLYCSGSIIRSRIVITTASCFFAGPKEKIFVKVGSNTITDIGQVIPVVDTKIHEYYRYHSEIDNDIALLLLKENVIFGDNVKKVLLGPPDMHIEPGRVIEVSGWGSPSLPQKYAYLLLSTDMIVMERHDCQEIYQKKITRSNFCATYGADHHLSDIGGPATYKQNLVGIVSHGASNKDGPHVATFTNISYFYRWIMLNTRRYLEQNCVPDKTQNMFTAVDEELYDDVQIGLMYRGVRATTTT